MIASISSLWFVLKYYQLLNSYPQFVGTRFKFIQFVRKISIQKPMLGKKEPGTMKTVLILLVSIITFCFTTSKSPNTPVCYTQV